MDHSLFTFIICYIFLLPIDYCIFLSLCDYILHWHIDFIKTKFVKFLKIDFKGVFFWLIQTIDQILHYLTYFLIFHITQNYNSFEHIFKKIISIFF